MKSSAILALTLVGATQAAYDVIGIARKGDDRVPAQTYVWAPDGNGTFPILDFSTGGGGQSPALPYNKASVLEQYYCTEE